MAAAIVVLVVDRTLVRPDPDPDQVFREIVPGKLQEVIKTIRKNPESVMKRMRKCNNF